MIALTATALGFATAPMRSIVSMALVGFLVCVAYAAAAFVSPAPTSLLELALAILCYDAGLLVCLVGIHTVDHIRSRVRIV